MTDDTRTDEPVNEVRLRGRLAAYEERDLPSGDVLGSFRLTVPRPSTDRGAVDSLECSTTKARARRTLARATIGDEVEVEGSLRRRFWRSPAGPASRYSVEAVQVRVIKRPARAGA